jgi:hypothetical protein
MEEVASRKAGSMFKGLPRWSIGRQEAHAGQQTDRDWGSGAARGCVQLELHDSNTSGNVGGRNAGGNNGGNNGAVRSRRDDYHGVGLPER